MKNKQVRKDLKKLRVNTEKWFKKMEKETKEEFDYGMLGTRTTAELLRIVQKLNFRGYVQHFQKNGNGDYNHLRNFFIWKRKDKTHEYLRITLMSEGWNENKVYWWNLENSFKPFAYKHNHRENANIQSERFRAEDTDRYLNYFKNIVDRAGEVE